MRLIPFALVVLFLLFGGCINFLNQGVASQSLVYFLVVDRQGRAIPGTVVKLKWFNGDPARSKGDFEVQSFTTDKEGRVVVDLKWKFLTRIAGVEKDGCCLDQQANPTMSWEPLPERHTADQPFRIVMRNADEKKDIKEGD